MGSSAGAQVHQDLVNHRGLRDARHDPHRAGAARARERIDLEDLPQERRPPARRLGGGELGHDQHRHAGIGPGGLRLAAPPARAVGLPTVVAREPGREGAIVLRDPDRRTHMEPRVRPGEHTGGLVRRGSSLLRPVLDGKLHLTLLLVRLTPTTKLP